MDNFRQYGLQRPEVVLVHGGPGANGEMAPLARALAPCWSVLEPLQTASTLAGQVEELKAVLESKAKLPVILVGFSWGAWLGFITAALYPALVKKLILIGSGPFEEKYVGPLEETRRNRLTEKEKNELTSLRNILDDPAIADKTRALARLGEIFSGSDAYDPIELASEFMDYRPDIFHGVWPEGAEWRKSGRLLSLGKRIKCPVVAIHGDYDPHPAEGVAQPLGRILDTFSFFLIKNCGHKPWAERQAGKEFFRVLENELFRS